MNNKIWIITILVSISSSMYVFDVFKPTKEIAVVKKKSSVLYSKNLFSDWFKQYDENKSRNKCWGLPEYKCKVIMKEDINKTKEVEVIYKKRENVICIEKSCYRLLAIKNIEEKFEAILYNAKVKDKIVQLKKNDLFESTIYIDDISSNNVEIRDKQTDRKWNFTLFDVNATKYKPKEEDD